MLAELTARQKLEIELRSELIARNTTLAELEEDRYDRLTELNEELVRKDHQLTESRKETATKNHQLTYLREELRQKELLSQQLETHVRHLESELNTTSHVATKLSKEAELLGAKLHSLAQVKVAFDKVIYAH